MHSLSLSFSLIVKGQMIAVVMEPVPRGPFEIQLDISTNDVRHFEITANRQDRLL